MSNTASEALARVAASFEATLPRHIAGLYIEHNRHRGYYETTAAAVERGTYDPQDFRDRDAIAACIAADSVWSVQWYPDTPVGSYTVCAATLADALTLAKEVEAENDRNRSK
jgi:hypothetical protein